MPVTLYYMPESPPCRAVQMLAAHIGLKLDLKYLNLATGEHKRPDFVAVNPQAVVPTIVDEDFVLWESRSILRYLVQKFAADSPLYPPDLRVRATIDRVLDFDMGCLYQSLGQYLRPVLQGKESDSEGENKFKTNLSLLENMLSDGFVCGSYLSLADISLVASLTFADSVLFDFSDWPRIQKWKQKLCTTITDYAAINDEPMSRFTEYMRDKLHLISHSAKSSE